MSTVDTSGLEASIQKACDTIDELRAENVALRAELEQVRGASSAAVPFLFEYGVHVNPHCYRGSDDGCYCGLDEAKKLMAALPAPPSPSKEKENVG